MKEKLTSFKKTIRNAKYMIGFIWNQKYGKRYFVLKYLYAIIDVLFTSINIVLPGLLINSLTNPIQIERTIILLLSVLVFPLLQQLCSLILKKLISKTNMKLQLVISVKYYNHISSMDYETLENPDIQIMQERAENTLNSTVSIVDKTSNIFSSVVGLLALTSIISTLNPLIVLVICINIAIDSLKAKKVNEKNYQYGRELNKIYRYQSFYPFALTNIDYAKEVRIFNLKSYFINMFVESVTESNEIIIKRQKEERKLSLVHSLTAFAQRFAVYAYCIYNIITKNLPIGTMTIYLSATSQFTNALNNVVQSYLTIANDNLAIQEMIDYFKIPLKQYGSGMKTPVFTKKSTIEFKNIYFKYPGSNHYALENFNLKLHGDEKLGIVGVNGSGKSTFIKLLMRLYFPEKGEILLDGININEFDYEKYMRLFAPVFQDFVTYPMTLKQNIVLSDEFNESKLINVSRNSGIINVAKKAAKGFEVRLDRDKEEDAIQLSGGEEQRMAIARACYHDGEIFLLDEPTASLDPVAESEIYSQFNKIITDKCAVLITHRLSAVQLVDHIAVIMNGHVEEYGTHAELYEKDGVYKDMFEKQAKFYRENTERE